MEVIFWVLEKSSPVKRKPAKEIAGKVIYFAGYKFAQDRFKVEDVEAAADLIVWSVDNRPGATAIEPSRPQDKTFVGNILESMLAYATGKLGDQPYFLVRCESFDYDWFRPDDGGGEIGAV